MTFFSLPEPVILPETRPPRAHAEPIRVGIVGLGRSGWNIHAHTLKDLPERFRVVAVTDPEPARREEARAELGCRVHRSFEALLDDAGVDLLVIASPNHLHTEHAIAALRAGRHVVAEKPFALCVEDADRMIDAAEEADRILCPFQNRRYEPHFEKVREVIDSGAIGRVVSIRLTWHQFTRRWDWQTLRRFGGGLLNNNGSHLLDHALQLLPPDAEPEVCADLQQVLNLGDTEDHVKIVLKTEGQPTIDVELSNASAFPQDRWAVMGTRGGLRGTTEALEWRTVDWDDMPERRLETAAATGRLYNHERIPWEEHRWELPAGSPREYARFYRDLFETIRHGRPQVIEAASVRRLLAVLERCHARCADAALQPGSTA